MQLSITKSEQDKLMQSCWSTYLDRKNSGVRTFSMPQINIKNFAFNDWHGLYGQNKFWLLNSGLRWVPIWSWVWSSTRTAICSIHQPWTLAPCCGQEISSGICKFTFLFSAFIWKLYLFKAKLTRNNWTGVWENMGWKNGGGVKGGIHYELSFTH